MRHYQGPVLFDGYTYVLGLCIVLSVLVRPRTGREDEETYRRRWPLRCFCLDSRNHPSGKERSESLDSRNQSFRERKIRKMEKSIDLYHLVPNQGAHPSGTEVWVCGGSLGGGRHGGRSMLTNLRPFHPQGEFDVDGGGWLNMATRGTMSSIGHSSLCSH